MKIFVKTLKGTHFEIEVKPEDNVADVKKNIESVQGQDVYPAAQQMLIHQGKVLKDTMTLEENKVAENSFVVIMLSKNKASSTGTSSIPAAPSNTAQPAGSTDQARETITAPQATAGSAAPPQSASESAPTPAPVPAAASSLTDVYDQAASNLVAGSNLEATVQQILDMGGGSWDRDTVVRALRAAYNNPERAVDYLYSGIPEQAEIPPVARAPAAPASGQAVNPSAQEASQPSVPSSGPNANPLDLFPQGLTNVGSNAAAGNLDFLRNSPQALRAMVQANPQILQPMLQELGKQNPHLMRLIQEHQPDFLRLINEPVEGEGNVLGQTAGAIPQAVTVTPEEREAIERFLVSSKLPRHLIKRKTNMGLFGRKFKASKVTTLANLAISRISILKKQHQVRCSLALSDVTQLLHLGRQEDALHRVELVIKEQNNVDALSMMEKYCHLLIENRVLIKTKGECPEELAEAISSLIFAASRWGEFPELHELREIFTLRYGNEFASQCVELRNNCSVQPKMIPKLSKRHTGSGKRRDMLNDIAADCGITLCVKDETCQISQSKPEVNSENGCAKDEEGS